MKQFLFFLFAISLTVGSAMAQGLDFGIKAGANAVKIDDVAFDDGFNFGYLAGVFLHINTGKSFGFGADAIFSQAATRTAIDANGVVGGINIEDLRDVKLNYLGVPVYMNIGKKFKLQLGAQFNLKLNESENIVNNASQVFKSNDIQGLAGFHWNLPLKLVVTGRYLAGLTDLSDLTNTNQWRSQTIQLAVGLKF